MFSATIPLAQKMQGSTYDTFGRSAVYFVAPWTRIRVPLLVNKVVQWIAGRYGDLGEYPFPCHAPD